MPMLNPNVVRERQLNPIGDKVMVKPLKPEKVTKGGIIIPDSAKRPPLMGIVMAAGPGRFVENPTPAWLYKALNDFFSMLSKEPIDTPTPANFIPNPVKAGDKVLFHRFSGTEIQDNDDKAVILMTSDDILAIVDPEMSHCFCTCHKTEKENGKIPA